VKEHRKDVEDMRRMRSLVKNVKWKAPSTKSVKCCPRCGSSKIKLSSRFDVWLTPEQYVCEDCGYKGPVVLEREIDEADKET